MSGFKNDIASLGPKFKGPRFIKVDAGGSLHASLVANKVGTRDRRISSTFGRFGVSGLYVDSAARDQLKVNGEKRLDDFWKGCSVMPAPDLASTPKENIRRMNRFNDMIVNVFCKGTSIRIVIIEDDKDIKGVEVFLLAGPNNIKIYDRMSSSTADEFVPQDKSLLHISKTAWARIKNNKLRQDTRDAIFKHYYGCPACMDLFPEGALEGAPYPLRDLSKPSLEVRPESSLDDARQRS
jgi:hypothetical protein